MVTLDDVADAAGVHPSTVSRSLSRPQLVSPDTLVRVQAAVSRLGYVPNRAARQLAGGRTSAVAILVPDITNPFFSGVVQAVQRAAEADQRLVLLADTGMRASTEIDAVESLATNVDGIVVCTPVGPIGPLREAAGGRPIVLVNRQSRGVASVAVDQRAIVALALAHLQALGHRSIGVLVGPRSYWSTAERTRQIEALSLGADTSIIPLGPGEPSFEGGRAALDSVLASGVSAVAAFNDVMALGLVAAAHEISLEIPGDLSIVGSDGVPLGEMSLPPLTTVAAPMADIGRLALRALDDQLGGGRPEVLSVRPHLVERSSTAAPPGLTDA